MSSGPIVVLVEVEATGAFVVSQEALTFARQLSAQIGASSVQAVVIGPLDPGVSDDALLAQLAEQGVTQLHCASHDRLTAYSAAAWASAVTGVVRATSARALLAAGSPRGNEVLAHAATRLDVAMAANVVAVEAADPLVVTRQVVGGAALEEMRLDDPVAVLSIAGHALDPAPAGQPSEPEVVQFAPELSDADLVASVARSEERVPDESAALGSARVVVGAGRGVGSADGFKELLELTDLVDGALGVSRVVTSLGWRPHHEQVGQTGSRITPDLYIPCGISGAIQHWAGVSSAKTILAINTDAEAPMVTRAHYAVIGDLHEIVPAINEEIRRRKG
jgi:electron transfer flavoprotein alpha subunit